VIIQAVQTISRKDLIDTLNTGSCEYARKEGQDMEAAAAYGVWKSMGYAASSGGWWYTISATILVFTNLGLILWGLARIPRTPPVE
jgi:hypothetical protein